MAIVKKNLASIIMGVLAALAVVGVYVWPVPSLYAKLSTNLHASLATGGQIDSMLSTNRTLPTLTPDSTEQKPLNGFPNDGAINAANKAIASFKDQAAKVVQAAVKINQDPHKFLVDGELPKPDDITRYTYQKEYGVQTANYAKWMPVLNFTARPTSDQIQAAKDQLKAETDKRLLVYTSPTDVTEQSRHEAEHAYNSKVDLVEGQLEQAAAEKYSLYLEDKALPGVDTKLGQINQGQAAPPPEKIFDTQLALWCIDDMTNAIKRCNDKFADVNPKTGQPKNDIIHNPIKQIELIGPPVPMIVGTPTGPVVKQVTASDTGRCCNSLYDVVTYTVKLVVDGEKVPLVLRELQTGQFVTVLKVQIDQIYDPAIEASAGFRFGDKPCVELEFTVEQLFMHQWTDPIFPDSRKQGLGGANNANGQIPTDTGDQSGVADPNQQR